MKPENKCSGAGSGSCARIMIPLSSVCNMQCVFCDREGYCKAFTSDRAVIPSLSAQQALFYIDKVVKRRKNIRAINLAGPGEVLLEIDKIREVVAGVKKRHPELAICLQTNGILMEEYAETLKEIGIDNIILNINALNKNVAKDMYSWVRMDKRIHRGDAAVSLILKKQLHAMQACKLLGFNTRVHSIYVPGLNDLTIVEIARTASEIGLDSFSFSQLGGTEKNPGQLEAIEKQCKKSITIKCAGEGIDFDSEFELGLLKDIAAGPIDPIQHRPYYAVATLDCINVNRHLGQAGDFNVYKQEKDRLRLIDVRKAPPMGGGAGRWIQLAETLADCMAILVSDAGANPIRELTALGIKVVRTDGKIIDAIRNLRKDLVQETGGCNPSMCSTCPGC